MGGDSALDVPALNVTSLSDAESFLESYGFLYISAAHRAEIEALRMEAWALIEEELLVDEPSLTPPAHIRNEHDPRRLLLAASAKPRTDDQRWACALLRVAHVMSHAHSGLNERFGPEVRAQVLGRFEPHLHQSARGVRLGRGPGSVKLVHFEVKHGKPLRSVAMKLLHKKENVSAGVFDQLGVRLVTRSRFETLLVVRYLRIRNVIMFANIAPSRSRNTLVDLDSLRDGMRALDDQVRIGNLDPERSRAELERWVEELPYPGTAKEYNRHSSSDYHSIQITCRRMIRIPNDAGELRFFFPYEIQIMDQRSWETTRSGRASHDEYKQRQRQTVKRRILRELLTLT